MLHMWWPNRRKQQELSAFADGELPTSAAERVAERVVFDDSARQELTRMRRMDALVAAAVAPPCPASEAEASTAAEAAFEDIWARLPATRATASGSRNWTPTVVASVGLLVTAGVAFAGLKRRGWV